MFGNTPLSTVSAVGTARSRYRSCAPRRATPTRNAVGVAHRAVLRTGTIGRTAAVSEAADEVACLASKQVKQHTIDHQLVASLAAQPLRPRSVPLTSSPAGTTSSHNRPYPRQ